MTARKIRVVSVWLTVLLLWHVFMPTVFSADGGGTNTVSPATAIQSSTGNAFIYTYTADATKDSGGMTIAVPSGWSAPQGSSGIAGYTAVSSTGTVADVGNVLDATTNWSATNHMALSADSSDKQEGSASLSNAITSYAGSNETWYFNYGSATSWGGINAGNLRVGMWLKSSVNLVQGDISWMDDDTAALASPLDQVNPTGSLSANTWTYTSATLGATTRTSVLSYGLRYTNDVGAVTLKADAPATLFDAADATTNWTGDSNITVATTTGQKEGTAAIRCTYAASAGTGTSGDCLRTSNTAVTWGPGTTVSFWVRSSVNTNAGDFDWVDDNAAGFGSPEDSVDLPALAANTWTYVTLTLAASSANKAAKSWGLRQVVDKGALTIDVDAMGKRIDAMDSTTGWTTPTAAAHTLATDGTTKKEGSNSLKNTITASAAAGDKWYENFGAAQNWESPSNYTTVGLWIQSSVNTTAGQLQFEYDDSAALASPLESINIGALTAGSWSFQKLSLNTGLSQSSVLSYGIKYTTDIGAATVYIDYFLLGPGKPTFSGSGPWTISMPFLSLSNSQTVTTTYGSGGGTSGVTASSSLGAHTFTTSTRDASNGTLTAISGSPQVTVETALTVDIVDGNGDSVASPSVTFSGINFGFSSQTGTGTLGTASQKIRVTNNSGTATWTLTIAATSGSTAIWSAGTPKYDFNDLSGATDGSDTDSYGGQLTLNPSVGTLAAVSPCSSTTDITKGSSASYSETTPVVSSITLLTAGASASTNCSWDFTGVSLSQAVPASQDAGTYTLSFTLTVA